MGVVEPPTPPTEVVGVRSMILYLLLYAVGALITARYVILSIQSEIDESQYCHDQASKKEREKVKDWGLEWNSRDTFDVYWKSALWISLALYYLTKFLMFPRGIKSKFARKLEKAEAAKQAALKDKEQEARIKELEDIVLMFGTAPLVDTEVQS